LHLLDVADKHRVLTPVLAVCSTSKLELKMNGAAVIFVSSGSFFVAPGTEFNPKSDFTIDIFFNDLDFVPNKPVVEFVPNKPVIPTLMHFADAVADTLRQFDEFVRTRK
jgi:hypothetical protein